MTDHPTFTQSHDEIDLARLVMQLHANVGKRTTQVDTETILIMKRLAGRTLEEWSQK
jgi:hypothetical protein